MQQQQQQQKTKQPVRGGVGSGGSGGNIRGGGSSNSSGDGAGGGAAAVKVDVLPCESRLPAARPSGLGAQHLMSLLLAPLLYCLAGWVTSGSGGTLAWLAALFGWYMAVLFLVGTSFGTPEGRWNTTRRKLMIASWSAPSEGTIHGLLHIDFVNANAYIARKRAEKNGTKVGSKVTVTHVVIKVHRFV
jgi:hypothetical protein